MRRPDPVEPRLDPILDPLREAPPAGVSPGFTARVLHRLDELEARRWWQMDAGRGPSLGAIGAGTWHRLLVPTAAALLVTGIAIGVVWQQARVRRAERLHAEVADLLAESRDLRREMEVLRTAGPADAPVVVLGGDEALDVVLDLRPWADQLAGSELRPAGLAAAATGRRPSEGP